MKSIGSVLGFHIARFTAFDGGVVVIDPHLCGRKSHPPADDQQQLGPMEWDCGGVARWAAVT